MLSTVLLSSIYSCLKKEKRGSLKLWKHISSCTHLFINQSITHSLTLNLTDTLTHLHIHSPDSHTHSLIQANTSIDTNYLTHPLQLTHTLAFLHVPTHSDKPSMTITHSLPHSLTHTLTNLLTHALTHLFTHSFHAWGYSR